MIARTNEYCTVERYTPAWALGTGLRVALAPGHYRVTGRDHVHGRRYFRLANAFRIDARNARLESSPSIPNEGLRL